MAKLLTILKREYAQIVKKKSFIIMTLLTPAMMAAFMVVPALFATRDVAGGEAVAILDRDTLGIGEALAEELTEYTTETTGQPAFRIAPVITLPPADSAGYRRIRDSLVQAIRNERVKYLIEIFPEAPLSDTNLLLVTNSDNFKSAARFEHRLTRVLSRIRLEQANVNLPVDSILALTRRVELHSQDTKGESIPTEIKLYAGFIFVLLIYMMIVIHGTALMRSVIEEKSNRIVEVLVSSVTPFQLMAGKIVGMGASSLTQVAIWIAVGLGIMAYSGSLGVDLNSPAARVAFDPLIVLAFTLFFVVGYLFYSVYFAFIGSIVNSDKESQNFLWPVVLCLMIPVIFATAVIQDPNATWIRVLSFLPPFAPTMMVLRVVFIAPTVTGLSLMSNIALEALVSLIILILTTVAAIWLTARVFRVGILMYGKRPTLPEIARWVRHA